MPSYSTESHEEVVSLGTGGIFYNISVQFQRRQAVRKTVYKHKSKAREIVGFTGSGPNF